MAKETNIQWTDSTWNPWYGCTKVAQGCKNCYMFRDFDRWHKNPNVITKSKTGFDAPLKWKDPRLVFTCSLSDFFIEEADQWRSEAWKIIESTPHFYQILTKRPERIGEPTGKTFPRNIILMLSVSTQSEFVESWPIMESLRYYYNVRIGLSLEPLLEPISLRSVLHDDHEFVADWVIIGGESGHKTGKYIARPCDPMWIMDIGKQCFEYKVPFFVKQLGSVTARQWNYKHPHGGDLNEWIFGWSGSDHLRQYPEFMNRARLLFS